MGDLLKVRREDVSALRGMISERAATFRDRQSKAL